MVIQEGHLAILSLAICPDLVVGVCGGPDISQVEKCVHVSTDLGSHCTPCVWCECVCEAWVGVSFWLDVV